MWKKFLEFLFGKKIEHKKPEATQETPVSDTTPPAKPEIEEVKVTADFKFVDSSHHHPKFDVKKYKAPILSNKCTQGLTMVDVTHAPRKKLCAENNIKYSGYHFYECRHDPIKQAQFYVKNHGEFICPPQLDYETEENKLGQTEQMLIDHKDNFHKCLCEVERLTGKTPWIYVNYGAASRIKFDKRFARFFVWFARYNSYLGPIPLPWTEETTAAWQFTEKGAFPGFEGGNDVNVYYGKINALKL